MRSPINIVGGFYKDPNKHWSAQDTLNWIPVKSERSGTRTEWQFRDAPGVKPLVKLGANSGGDFIEAGPGRGLRNVEGKLFAVAGNTLFQITNDLISIPYGTIPGVNRVSMAHNQYGSANQLLTVNGSAGYVFNTSTLLFEKITDTGYPGAFVADYVDGYLAQVESLGRYWFHSDLAEAREYNTLDQYEAEGDPDRIVTLHVAYREVLLFGADTIEPYVNAPRGSGIAPFQRAANTVIQCGCSAKFSPRNIAGVVPFLDDKRVVQYLQGYSVNRISTVGIEQALGECSREEISNAYAYTYEDRGHKIYYLTVPGRFTFGYDFLTQEWHRRATSGLPDLAFTDVAFWNGMWVALDRRYGRLYELDWGYKLDSCEPLVRERVTGVLSNNQNRVTVNELELMFNVGTEESVCQPFEEQPEGPSITGNAPDGNVGSPWGPYSYTVTGGTPPYVVTLRPGGTLPAGIGPLSAAGTIAAGDPTAVETKTFTVRATDANGLFDEIEDTINITASIMLAGTKLFPSSPGAYFSGSGEVWTPVTDDEMPLNAPAITHGDGRWLCITTDDAFFSDNLSEWTESTSVGASGGQVIAASYGDEVFLAVGSNGLLYRSSDNCVNFADVTDVAANYQCVAYGDGRWIVGVAGTILGPYRTSTDGALTFTQGSEVMDYQVSCAIFANGIWAVGGGAATGGDPGAIRVSEDGVTWGGGIDSLTRVESIAYGNGVWVAICFGGEIIFSDDNWDTFGTSATVVTPAAGSNQVCFNGSEFVLVDGNLFADGITRSSTDGDTWSDGVTVAIGDNLKIVSGYQP